MTFLDNPTDWLALRISESYGTKEAEAKGSICVFLLGCYCKIHKPILEKAKEGILKLKVSCMLMEDLKIGMDESLSPNYAIKFQLT